MKRKLTKLEKFGLIAAVVAGILFFYLKNVYDPQQRSLERAREQLNRTIRDYNQLQAAEPLFQLRGRLQGREQEQDRIKQALAALQIGGTNPQEFARTKQWVYREMERLNMRVLNVTPGGRRQELFDWHVFEIRMEGDFAGLVGLLQAFNGHPAPLRVDRVTVIGDQRAWPLEIALELWIMG